MGPLNRQQREREEKKTKKHLAENSKHLASISFSTPCGTIEGGETPVPTFAPTDRYGLWGFN